MTDGVRSELFRYLDELSDKDEANHVHVGAVPASRRFSRDDRYSGPVEDSSGGVADLARRLVQGS